MGKVGFLPPPLSRRYLLPSRKLAGASDTSRLQRRGQTLGLLGPSMDHRGGTQGFPRPLEEDLETGQGLHRRDEKVAKA